MTEKVVFVVYSSENLSIRRSGNSRSHAGAAPQFDGFSVLEGMEHGAWMILVEQPVIIEL